MTICVDLLRRIFLLDALLVLVPCGSSPACSSEAECHAKLTSLTKGLDATHEEMKEKHHTLKALETIRDGVLTGQRIDLPSAQRRHLEKGVPLVSEISFDARHKPISTNFSQHFTKLRSIAPEAEVRFHTFMPLKKSASSGKAAPSALLVIVDGNSKLSMYTLKGEALLSEFDLGHGPGRVVTHVSLSPNQENHFILSGDDRANLRVHSLKVVAKREKKAANVDGSNETAGNNSESQTSGSESAEETSSKELEDNRRQDMPQPPVPQQLIVTSNFSCAFTLPSDATGEVRKLNSLLPLDRGTQTYFVTGDTSGGISVFYRNGTIKGRVRVTDDPGGVLGLLRGQGQTVLFWSSHSFGFFSVAQIDVQYPPCTGWNSPLYDIAVDPSLSYSRVVLALADGNVVVFATTRGKSKACDLTLKFPHVSTLPFRLHAIKGHILGMPVPAEEEDMKADHLREFFFFNLAAMEAGYGATPSRAVPIQISFKPQQPTAYALHTPNAGSGSGATAERTKAQVAICFEDQRGLELYEVNLKQPVPPKGTAVVEDGGLGRSDSSDGYGWLNWFPKIGVFGIALIGVVIWNVRKVTAQRRHDRRDDFDEEFLKERLRERKLKKPQDDTSASRIGGLGAGSASSGIGGGASSSSGGASVRDD